MTIDREGEPSYVFSGVEYIGIQHENIYKKLKKTTLTEAQQKCVAEALENNKPAFAKGQNNNIIIESIFRMKSKSEKMVFSSIISSPSYKKSIDKAGVKEEFEAFSKSFCEKNHVDPKSFEEFQGQIFSEDSDMTLISNFIERLNLGAKQKLFSFIIRDDWVQEVSSKELALIFSTHNKENLLEPEDFSFAAKVKSNYAALKTSGKSKIYNFTSSIAGAIGSDIKIDRLSKIVSEFTKKFHFKVSEDTPKNPIERSEAFLDRFSVTSKVEDKILNFDTTKPHTMNVEKYLENRVPHEVLQKVKIAAKFEKVEFFLGSVAEMEAFYQPLKYKGALVSPTSTQFHLLINPSNPKEYKIILTGFASQTRMNHQLLQFKFAGLSQDELEKITIRGTLDAQFSAELGALGDSMKEFSDLKKVCMLGMRWLPMALVSKNIHSDTSKSDGSDQYINNLYLKLNTKTHTYGSLSYDTVKLKQVDGTDVVVIAFRMPNGDYAGKVTDQLIQSGVESFMLIGAGGSLKQTSGVGGYQIINSSKYGETTLTIPEELKVKLDFDGTAVPCVEGPNITVDSPLEENQEWLESSRDTASSVDVESFHILNSIIKRKGELQYDNLKVIAGLFNSDVVGDHPLEEKISTDNAYVHMEEFLGCAISALGVKFSPLVDLNQGGGGSK